MMGIRLVRVAPIAVMLAATLAATSVRVLGQSGTTNGEWRHYGGDSGSTRYAPLDQIDAGNFNQLEVAWRFKTDALGPWPCVLERRQRGAHPLRHARLPAGSPRRPDRRARPGFRP